MFMGQDYIGEAKGAELYCHDGLQVSPKAVDKAYLRLVWWVLKVPTNPSGG